MKNKKGFTLVEVLAVIVIIGVIMSVAIPAAVMVSNSIKERAYNSKMENYLAAAESYAKNNKDIFGEATAIQISVETLLAYGYADSDYSCDRNYGCIEDPRTRNNTLNDEPITIKKNKNIYQALLGPMEIELSLNFVNNGATTISSTGVGCQTSNGNSCEVTLPTITRDGYIILGWDKISSSTSATYAPGETIDIYENATYYAITSKQLVITFNKNTAASISSNSANCTMYNTQSSCSVTMPTITPNSGSTVIGWNTNSSATTKQYSVSQNVTFSTDKTYYAITKLITYTCYKAVTSTSCSYTSTSSAITACQAAGYINCTTNGCASSNWTYHFEFAIINNLLVEERTYDCVVEGRTSINLRRTCTSSNIKELLIAGNDGIQDLTDHYCVGESTGVRKTLYWNSSSSTALNLSESNLYSTTCDYVWARAEDGYTKWDYSGDSYLYGQTSCPAGYTATLE